MKAFTVNGSYGKFILNLPTDFTEITPEYLLSVTEELSIAKGYSLIAIVYRERLAIILNSASKQQALNTAVIPVFVKHGETEHKFIESLSAGDKVVITGSNIARGIHIAAPNNELNIDRIVNLCKDDKNVYKEAITSREYLYFVEFKLVPDYDICGKIGDTKPISNQYIIPSSDAQA